MTFGDNQTLTATFDDNATTRAIIAKMPMTLQMMDLYGDEMCYRFPEALPTDNVEYKLHKKGEIFYWPPSHSFVIRYIETDEWLDLQHLGQVDSGVDVLNGIGDTRITFELIDAAGIRQPQAEHMQAKEYILTGMAASASARGTIIHNGKKVVR